MADIVDITQERDEHNARYILASSKKPEAPKATGFCLWCEEPTTEPSAKFCSKDCAEDFEKNLQARLRRGSE